MGKKKKINHGELANRWGLKSGSVTEMLAPRQNISDEQFQHFKMYCMEKFPELTEADFEITEADNIAAEIFAKTGKLPENPGNITEPIPGYGKKSSTEADTARTIFELELLAELKKQNEKLDVIAAGIKHLLEQLNTEK